MEADFGAQIGIRQVHPMNFEVKKTLTDAWIQP